MKKLLLILSFVSLTITTNAQWQQTALNSGNINCFAVSGNNIFAGTEENGIYLSTDNGNSWSLMNNGMPMNNWGNYRPVKALAISGSNIFAGIDSGGVYRSSNNGQIWTAMNTGLADINVYSLAVDNNHIYAGIYGGNGAYVSSNNGSNWTAISTGLTQPYVMAFLINGSNIFVGTMSGGVYLTMNGGNSWTAMNTGLANLNVYSLARNGSNIFAGTDGNGISLSTNNGSSWTAASSGMPAYNTVNSFAVKGSNIFAGTFNGVFLSSDNGGSWDSVSTGLTNLYVKALTIVGDTVFAGTSGSGVWKLFNCIAPKEEICYVEFDTATSKNRINWSTTLPLSVDSINIYNEVSTNVWTSIGKASTSQDHFIDPNSNPFSQSYSYKIRTIDTCGQESDASAFHTTITLLATYDQGTNTYGFTWSAYHGLTISNYYLYGVTSNGTETLLGTVPGNQYFYNVVNPISGFVKYFVGFNTPTCGSKTDHMVKSNWVESTLGIADNTDHDNSFSFYPNPVKNKLTIESLQKSTINISNIQGQIVLQKSIQQGKTDIDISILAKGIYILRLNSNDKIAVAKIVKE